MIALQSILGGQKNKHKSKVWLLTLQCRVPEKGSPHLYFGTLEYSVLKKTWKQYVPGCYYSIYTAGKEKML